MQKQLQLLCEVVKRFDDDHIMCMQFFEKMSKKGIDQPSKFDIIVQTLHEIEHSAAVNSQLSCVEIDSNVSRLVHRLNERYFQNQHYTWPSHMCHFHLSVKDWLNCPHTCLTEVGEFLERILKGD